MPDTLPQSELTIVRAQTRPQLRDFHQLVGQLYRDDPNFVPPLLLERQLHFSTRHNPFFRHARHCLWVAYRNGRPVGRISAQIDDLHLDRYQDATGHWGFLEAVDEAAVFTELFRHAEQWLRQHGLTRAVGPVSFSMWDQPGLLVDGFDSPPMVMMGHARPYFQHHVAAAGYRPVQDLLAYQYSYAPLPVLAERAIARAVRTGKVRLRTVRKDRKHIDDEIALIMDILNDGWSQNWGFVPMTAAEATDMGGVLRLLVPADHVAIAEYDGQAAAFALIIPNLNEAIRDLGGRLAPFGWAKLLWRLKVAGLRSARMPLMGIRRAWATSPLGAGLALAVIAAARAANMARGCRRGELSWILDQNEPVKHIIETVGATPYKRYRIYEKALISPADAAAAVRTS